MSDALTAATDAKIILVPKGDDSNPCLQAFEDATGITVPEFVNRTLEAEVNGKTFLKVKGSDIPGLIAAGFGDIGLTGSDSCEDYNSTSKPVDFEPIGERMCRFVLLAPSDKAESVRKQLNDGKSPLQVATSFPKLLNKCASEQKLNLTPASIKVSGSVEIMPRLLGVPLVADLVSTGETARVNGLVEVRTLMDVYPAIVVKQSTITSQEKDNDFAFSDIELIDETLRERCKQLNNVSVDSYTLALMRDSNKAGKKAGEEFSEVMMAITGDGAVADCESEIADLTYAQLISAYSQGKQAKLSNVVSILINRNRNGKPSEDLPKSS